MSDDSTNTPNETIEVTRDDLRQIHESNVRFSETFSDGLRAGIEAGSENFYEELLGRFDDE